MDDRRQDDFNAEQSAQALAQANDQLKAKNHALAEALTRAGKELNKARAQLAQLAQPPMTFATMVRVESSRTDEYGVQHASAEVIAGTRRMIVPVAANFNVARLAAGNTVLLNESMVLVDQRAADDVGVVRTITQVLDDGRLLVRDASPTSPSTTSAASTPRLNASATPSNCRSCIVDCSNVTICAPRRACCCTVLPATAKRLSPRPWRMHSPLNPARAAACSSR